MVWEYPSNAQQGNDLLALLATVRLHMPDDQYVLTTALPASRAVLQHIPLRSAAEYLDFVNLMAFDFAGPWAAKSGHHAQLYGLHRDEESGSACVQFMTAAGFPSKKILLGIPPVRAQLPGRGWTGPQVPRRRRRQRHL